MYNLGLQGAGVRPATPATTDGVSTRSFQTQERLWVGNALQNAQTDGRASAINDASACHQAGHRHEPKRNMLHLP